MDSFKPLVVVYARCRHRSNNGSSVEIPVAVQVDLAASYARSINADIDVVFDHSSAKEGQRFAEVLHRFSQRPFQRGIVFLSSLDRLGSTPRPVQRRLALLDTLGIDIHVANLGRALSQKEIASRKVLKRLLRECSPRRAWVTFIVPISSTRTERRRWRRAVLRRLSSTLAQSQHVATNLFPWSNICPDKHIAKKFLTTMERLRPHSMFVVRYPWWLDECEPDGDDRAIWVRMEPLPWRSPRPQDKGMKTCRSLAAVEWQIVDAGEC